MGMLDILKAAPTRQVAVETGSIRDMYMKHLEDANLKGVRPLTLPEFVEMLRQQDIARQQQLGQPVPQGGMMTRP